MYNSRMVKVKKKTPAQAVEAYELVMLDIAESDSVRKACAKHGVSHGAFLEWVDKGGDERKDHYARAVAESMDAQADELIDIGHQASRAESAVTVAGLRLLSDNKKWLLSKRDKRYGDKVELSGDAANPVAVALDVSRLSTQALTELMAERDANNQR